MYQMLLITAFFALLLPFGIAVPTWTHAGLIVCNGLTNAIGQYWWTRALHLAPASAVTPFFYLSLVWAAVLGFVVWGDVPTVHLLIGSAVVVGSGLFLLWREQAKL
jgi:drug/metabolite transporter (DMT)-like permease